MPFFMFYDALVNARLAGDMDFLQELADNSYMELAPFFGLFGQLQDARYVSILQQIEQVEMQLDLVVNLSRNASEDPDRDSLKGCSTISFSSMTASHRFLRFRRLTVRSNRIRDDRRNDQIKDEIVSVLQETLA